MYTLEGGKTDFSKRKQMKTTCGSKKSKKKVKGVPSSLKHGKKGGGVRKPFKA